MRLGDLDELKTSLNEHWMWLDDGEYADGFLDAIKLLKKAPTIDAVPVVRCKDCINWDKEKLYCHHPAGMSFCGKKCANEGFCCFGERKEGDDEDR